MTGICIRCPCATIPPEPTDVTSNISAELQPSVREIGKPSCNPDPIQTLRGIGHRHLESLIDVHLILWHQLFHRESCIEVVSEVSFGILDLGIDYLGENSMLQQ